MSDDTTPPAALTPEAVEALLDADVANIIALVTAGQPLTKAQRETLAEHVKRKKPAAKQNEAPPAPAASTTPAPSADPGAFSLAGETITAKDMMTAADAAEDADAIPGEYRRPLKFYADRYGYSLRAVKGWIAEGRAVPEPQGPKPPPLDNPEAMLVWWHEVKANRAPTRLLAVAQAARNARVGTGEPTEKGNKGTGAGTPAPAPTTPATPTPPKPRAVGFAASLERVRQAEAEANERYLVEFGKPDDERDDAKTSRLRREWSELSEQLRFLEKAAPDVLAKSGEMLTTAEVRRVLTKLHGPIVSGVRSLFRRTRQKAQAGATLDDLEKIYAAEVERLFGELVASEFAPA